jgi:hypothetical protein
MTLKVTVPLVTARTENDRIVYLYFGDVVPSGLSKDSLKHLEGLGFIAEDAEAPVLTQIEQPEADTPAPVVGGDVPKPAGNAGLDEWAAYARSRGATDADLDGLSRNDVRDLYK